ncbi:MAG: type 4 fimbrial biosis protein [Betaproteobacteria bacterium]|nr:type 4 fimbrial biosis protein [Betaproteobacteria bacterium]
MIRINLLPHREIRRRRLQQQYFVMLGVVAAVGVAVAMLVHTSLTNSFENQQKRNAYLQAEIVKLDKEIEDIKKLKEMTASLLSRKKVVETLQSNRAEVVHLLDELTRQLPDGVYLKGIKQQGSRVTINGYTQSQARVSTLMRNLDASPYLENANLIEIRAVPLGTSRINEFTLAVNIERPKTEDDKTAKPAKTAATGTQ